MLVRAACARQAAKPCLGTGSSGRVQKLAVQPMLAESMQVEQKLRRPKR